MRHVLVLMTVIALTGCGADGDPIRPAMTTTIGVGSNGVHSSTSVSATSGNVSVTVGL